MTRTKAWKSAAQRILSHTTAGRYYHQTNTSESKDDISLDSLVFVSSLSRPNTEASPLRFKVDVNLEFQSPSLHVDHIGGTVAHMAKNNLEIWRCDDLEIENSSH